MVFVDSSGGGFGFGGDPWKRQLCRGFLVALFVLLLVTGTQTCNAGYRYKPPKNYPYNRRYRNFRRPLLPDEGWGQPSVLGDSYVRGIQEFSSEGAGEPLGSFIRDSPDFRQLQYNNNSGIVFEDEERTGDDHFMTKRCSTMLNRLAILVRNYPKWDSVRLKVIEAWDDFRRTGHRQHSLHYEGRAVDVTTADRSREIRRKRHGMVGRLALIAGFDYVVVRKHYVHCACKSEQATMQLEDGAKMGCFPAESKAFTETGVSVPLHSLRPGVRVLAVHPASGRTLFSPVVAFLHYAPQARTPHMRRLHLSDGTQFRLTGKHLVFASPATSASISATASVMKRTCDTPASPLTAGCRMQAVYADSLQPGDILWKVVSDNGSTYNGPAQYDGLSDLVPVRVVNISEGSAVGLYAPLTASGTIVVDGVASSCYAHVASHRVANLVFKPLQLTYASQMIFWNWISWPTRHLMVPTGTSPSTESPLSPPDGIHWYARALCWLTDSLFPTGLKALVYEI